VNQKWIRTNLSESVAVLVKNYQWHVMLTLSHCNPHFDN
jgi:hypothetical protein